MRPVAAAFLACVLAPNLVAQAPASVDLWRVVDGTLAVPGAIAAGPIGAFWNPAGVVVGTGFAGGVDVVQTPDVANVTGMILGATYGLGRHFGFGLLAGRVSVGDLVRTTSSPVSEGPEISVYSQFVGGSGGGRVGPLTAAASVLVHDTRLDAADEGGVTLDVGARLAPARGLLLAASSHLGAPLVTDGPAASLLAAAEYGVETPPLFGLRSAFRIRYGFTSRQIGEPEHQGSAGLLLAERLAIDLGVAWVGGYGEGDWLPVLGIAFQAGPYHVGITRGSGASGVGAAYRLSLAVDPSP